MKSFFVSFSVSADKLGSVLSNVAADVTGLFVGDSAGAAPEDHKITPGGAIVPKRRRGAKKTETRSLEVSLKTRTAILARENMPKDREFHVSELHPFYVANRMKPNTASVAMGYLVKAGIVERLGGGIYRAKL